MTAWTFAAAFAVVVTALAIHRARRRAAWLIEEDERLTRPIWFVPSDARIAAAEAAGDRAAVDVARRQQARRARLAEVGVTAMHRHHDLDITQEWRVLAELEMAA